jgi:uncharacterized membrane protein
MMFLSPVCHLLYFVWMLPTIMGLLLMRWENRRDLALGAGWIALLILNVGVHIVAHLHHFPFCQTCRDLGLTTCVAMIFWTIALVRLRQQTHIPMTAVEKIPAENVPIAA